MTLMQRRRALMGVKKRGGRLPGEYQKVEYIQSSATQAIITPNWLKQNSEFYCEFEYVPVQLTNGYYPTFGCASPSIGFARANDSAALVYVSFGNQLDKRINNVPTFRDGFHSIIMNSKKTIIDDTYSVSYTATVTENSDRKIALFARMSSTNQLELFSYRKIRVFRIKEGETLVLDLVPCYRKSDGEIGMYDIVNNAFYTNAGTGTFTKGGNV